MNELELIISLFPLVFMIHEFEEIICLTLIPQHYYKIFFLST